MYLVPVFGMLWGFIFLNEVVTPHMLIACPIIVLGTALASGNVTFRTQHAKWRKARAARETPRRR